MLIGDGNGLLFGDHCAVLVGHVPADTQLFQELRHCVPSAEIVVDVNFQRRVESAGSVVEM
jgi:hypothetical protein